GPGSDAMALLSANHRSQGGETVNLFSEAPEIPMIAQLLQQLDRAGALRAPEIADLCGVAESTAYDYISGRTEMKVCRLRSLLHHASDDRVRDLILADLAGNTGYHLVQGSPELDVNGDGDIDTNDVMAAALQTVRDASDAASGIHATSGDGEIDDADLRQIEQQLQLMLNHTMVAMQVARFLNEHRPSLRRRQARGTLYARTNGTPTAAATSNGGHA
ncbi:MAG: hypothetical protein AAF797_17810, partial [Planctomycetota bacterium]